MKRDRRLVRLAWVALPTILALISCGEEEQKLRLSTRAVETCTQITLTATQLTVSDTDSPYIKENVIDNNTSTRWSGQGPTGDTSASNWGWIQVDLGSIKNVCRVEANWWYPDARSYSYSLYGEADDSTPDVVVASGTTSLATKVWDTLDFTSPVRYIRLNASASVNEWNSLLELRVFVMTDTGGGGTVGGPVGGNCTDSATQDKWCITKLFPATTDTTKSTPYYLNDPRTDGRLDNKSDVDLSVASDGVSWQADKAGETAKQIRLEANSLDGKKWLNTEMTIYAKFVDMNGESDRFQMYSRGGHHSSSRECSGQAYKAAFNIIGTAPGRFTWRKEMQHASFSGYAPDKDVTSSGGTASWGSTTYTGLNKWNGFKLVIANVNVNGVVRPRMVSYVDRIGTASFPSSHTNNWIKVASTDDTGGWGKAGSLACDGCSGDACDTRLFLDAGEATSSDDTNFDPDISIGAFRTDGTRWWFRYMSVREIDPANVTAASTVLSGCGGACGP